jgi:fructose-1,6-bisphosphatase II
MRLASGTVRYIESSHRWDKLMRISSLQYARRSNGNGSATG